MRKDLIVIPARGGSKGIPLKNIYPLNGKPLIQYTLDSLNNEYFIDNFDIVVSSDSDSILEETKKYSNIISLKRPNEFSTDIASTEDVLIHVLKTLFDNQDKKYDYVVTLQPTSPLRKSSTIIEFIEHYKLNASKYDSQLTFTEHYGDFWIKDKNSFFRRIKEDAPRRRQEREPLFLENSAIYITKVSSLMRTHSILGESTNGYVIDEIEAVDINNMSDLLYAEYLLKKK